MPARNINVGRNIYESAVRTWSDGAVDNVSVRSGYEGYEHVTSVTPNYRQIIQSGGRLPVRPLHWAKSRWVSCRGSLTFRDTRKGARSATYVGPYDLSSYNGNPGDFTYPSSEQWDKLVARATSSVLSKVKDQKVNLAQMFAERKQTADLIASTATRLAGAFTSLRRGNFPGCLQALGLATAKREKRIGRRFERTFRAQPVQASANTWLELQYGWSPLLQDVYGSAEAVAKAHLGKRNYSKATSRITETIHDSWKGTDGYVRKSQRNTTTYNVIVGVTFCYDNPALNDASSLGLTNPAQLAWELLPYSFVVDWFLPVGDALSNLDATLGCQFIDGYIVKAMEQNVSMAVEGVGRLTTFSDGTFQSYDGVLSGSKWRKQVDLAALSGFPSVTYPRFKNPISTSHVTSALALLKQAFRR